MIHETALIDPNAEIGKDVSIGPYSIVEGNVTIGDGTTIGPHVVIKEFVKIGCNNRIYQFCSIGEIPQDLKFGGEETYVEIGDDNVIREFVTMNRGTDIGGGVTRMGSNCMLMSYVHVAHDCHLGDFVIMANASTLAGHISIDDHALIGGLSAIHQFSRIGAYSMIGGMSGVSQDVAPYLTVVGNRARTYGLNLIGLKRNGFSAQEIRELKGAYRIMFRESLSRQDALNKLNEEYPESEKVKYFTDFIAKSQRGICR